MLALKEDHWAEEVPLEGLVHNCMGEEEARSWFKGVVRQLIKAWALDIQGDHNDIAYLHGD